MQNYRYVIAIALTLAVILGWNHLSQMLGLSPAEEFVNTANGTNESVADSDIKPVLDPVVENGSAAVSTHPLLLDSVSELPSGKKIAVKTPLFNAEFNATGGLLTSFTLNRYTDTLENKSPFPVISEQAAVTAPMGLLLNEGPTWKIGDWSSDSTNLDLAAGENGTISFVWDYSGIRLTRELTFNADSYLIDEKIHIENTAGAAVAFNLGYSMSATALSSEDDSYNITKIGYLTSGDKFDHKEDKEDLGKGAQEDDIKWGSIQSNYFIAAVIPGVPTSLKARYTDDVYRITLYGGRLVLNSTEPLDLTNSYYLGPKERDNLEAAPADLEAAIDYGWFGFIAKPMIMFLSFLYEYLGNYGLAIIVLTLIIKIAMWPLARKSYKSMEKMKQLQPMIKKIQEKYKDDKQKASQETMRLYKTYKVNPAGGCMPLLLQIPIFIGLYQGLLNAVELRHAPFITYFPFTDHIWLADLSVQDPYYITPVIMGISMFIQQRMSPPMGDPTQAKVMMFMPIVFTFLFARFPSGLVLYWLVNNLFSLAQQWFTMRGKKGGKPSLPEEKTEKKSSKGSKKAESPA